MEKNIYELSVFNREVRYIYKTRMLQWVTNKLKIDSSRYYSFINLLAKGQVEGFKEELQRLLLNSTNFYQTGETRGELFYSGFMLDLLNMLTVSHIIDREKETGKGRADIVLPPKVGQNNNAIIIEYKIAKKEEDLELVAKSGLLQINDKQYDTKIKEYSHIQKIIKISIAFYGKQVALQYKLNIIDIKNINIMLNIVILIYLMENKYSIRIITFYRGCLIIINYYNKSFL